MNKIWKKISQFLFGSLLIGTVAFAEQPSHKVVVDLTTDNNKTMTTRFIKGFTSTLHHFQQSGGKTDAVVIIHGGAYRFFVEKLEESPYNNDKELKNNQQELRAGLLTLKEKYNVKFEVCSEGMKVNNLTKDMFYTFVHPVPSAQIALIEWQNKGYAYLPFR